MNKLKSLQTLSAIICVCLLTMGAISWLVVETLPPTEKLKNIDHRESITVDTSPVIPQAQPLANENTMATQSATPWTLLSTGDMMLGRSVNSIGARKKDFSWSLREVNPYLANFDLVVANLETPITDPCPVTDEGMIFCADASAAAALAASNIDIVTLANNHVYNHGPDGYRQTQDLLAGAGELYVNDTDILTFTREGITYGLLAYDDVTYPIDLDDWRNMITHAASQVDVLIVALHFGIEYVYTPTNRQITLAHAAIDSGAILILGNHSHWLGSVEKYHGGAIIYSHGNFVFDQEWSNETKAGLAAAWHWQGRELVGVDIYPIHITNYGLSHWAAGTTVGEQILDVFQRESSSGARLDDHVTINLTD
ncbi:CapA family protein [bacterium]|nr:CapA family protein [bacterium]